MGQKADPVELAVNEEYLNLPADNHAVPQSRHQQGQEGIIFDFYLPQGVHTTGGAQCSQGTEDHIQRQPGADIHQVGQHAAQGQPRNGGRSEQRQHIQCFRHTELHRRGGGARQQQVLGVGQRRVHGGNACGLGNEQYFFVLHSILLLSFVFRRRRPVAVAWSGFCELTVVL